MVELTQGPQSISTLADDLIAAKPSHDPAVIDTLKQAMRRARFDDAERTGVMADLRAARLGRLEVLQEALHPLLRQIPPDVDLFDIGVMPGVNPRLFIDMIGFVEMGRDSRIYNFYQDTRHGRVKIAESADTNTLVDAITDYVARRLLERDRALAAEMVPNAMPRRMAADDVGIKTAPATQRRPTPRRAVWYWTGVIFAFVIDLLGSITFFTILAFVGWIIWNGLHKPG